MRWVSLSTRVIRRCIIPLLKPEEVARHGEADRLDPHHLHRGLRLFLGRVVQVLILGDFDLEPASSVRSNRRSLPNGETLFSVDKLPEGLSYAISPVSKSARTSAERLLISP